MTDEHAELDTMPNQNRAVKSPQSSLENTSDVRPNAGTEVNHVGPIQKTQLKDISAQQLLLAGTKGYSQQQLLKDVGRRLAIRRETMSAEAFARLSDPRTRHQYRSQFSAEALAEVTLLWLINYAELTKPGGEFERIAERHGGRVLTDEEMNEFFGDSEGEYY